MKTADPTNRELESLPLVPLRDMVVFPHMMQPFVVGRESSIRALEAALATPVKKDPPAGRMTGRTLHRSSPKSSDASCDSRARIQLTLPCSVLISPLCAIKR